MSERERVESANAEYEHARLMSIERIARFETDTDISLDERLTLLDKELDSIEQLERLFA